MYMYMYVYTVQGLHMCIDVSHVGVTCVCIPGYMYMINHNSLGCKQLHITQA